MSVARVRLYLMPANNSPVFRFIRPDGTRDATPALELRAFVDLKANVRPGGRDALGAAYPKCIIDTGAPLSIVPEYVWSHFDHGSMVPLPFDPAMPYHHRFVTVSGGTFPYDLGEIDIRLTDHSHRTMDLRVVAQFTRDSGTLTIPMVLGLSGGTIDGRILHSEPDAASPFGQAWTLEDA